MNFKLFVTKYQFSCFVFLGIVMGTITANLAVHMGLTPFDIYNGASLSDYSKVSVNDVVLWKYILRSRFRDFSIISILALTSFRSYIIALYLIYIGCCVGIFASTAIMYYGLLGVGIYLASVLPQYIFYGMIVYLLYRMTKYGSFHKKYIGIYLAVAIIFIFIGTYLEAYLNPAILKRIYEYVYHIF